MNDICVYFLQTYGKYISHDYYCQITTHDICDDNSNHWNIKEKKENLWIE